MDSKNIRTPLAKAKGKGAAHAGAHHWIHQRMTAIALVPLVVWFVFNVVGFVGMESYDIIAFFGAPINAILMALLIIASFYHAALGLQVVVEDYVHRKATKVITLLVIKLGLFALGTTAVLAIVKLHLSN